MAVHAVGVVGLGVVLVVALALSFSSTVFTVKILQGRGDEQGLCGRTTISILVMQDIVAVVFSSISGGAAPSLLTFGLALLVPALVILLRRFT